MLENVTSQTFSLSSAEMNSLRKYRGLTQEAVCRSSFSVVKSGLGPKSSVVLWASSQSSDELCAGRLAPGIFDNPAEQSEPAQTQARTKACQISCSSQTLSLGSVAVTAPQPCSGECLEDKFRAALERRSSEQAVQISRVRDGFPWDQQEFQVQFIP